MRTHCDGGHQVSTVYLFLPGKVSSGGTCLNCWLRDSHGNFQITLVVAKTKSCSPLTDIGAVLSRTISTQLIEHREVALVPIWSLQLYVLVSLVHEGTLQDTE